MPTTPRPIDPDILGDKINDWLEQDGKLPEAEWRKMMAYLLTDMRSDIKALMVIPNEISTLKKKNLILMAEKHPKIATPILLAFGILFVIHFVEILPMLERALTIISKFLI